MNLVVLSGPDSGQVFRLDKDVVTIGRGPENDIVLSDEAASRAHCELSREGDGFVVRDLRSANGTFVNDERIILPFLLRAGNTVRLGETTFVVEDDSRQRSATRDRMLVGVFVVLAAVLIAGVLMANPPAPSQVASAHTPLPSRVLDLRETSTPTSLTETEAPTPLASVASAATESRPLPIPTLLQPAPRTMFKANEAISFSWGVHTPVADGQVYRVQVSTNSEFTQIACDLMTRETNLTIPGEGIRCTDRWQAGQHYYWRVLVLPTDSSSGELVANSGADQVYEFTWER